MKQVLSDPTWKAQTGSVAYPQSDEYMVDA